MRSFRWAFMMSFIVFIALSLVGWGQPSPSLIVESYFSEIQKGTEGDFLSLFNDAKMKKTDQLTDVDQRIFELIKDIQFEVLSQKMNKEVAYVKVSVTGPDIAAELMQYQSAFIQESQDHSSPVSFDESLMLSCLEEVTYTERSAEIRLIKKDSTWKITDSRESILYLLFNLQSATFNQ
ncbi:hypothetical protein PNU17_06060 [Turicibacter sanguinis]|jgi:hypothetical protein|uniref:DUF4878 domain-containing protein n=2 Tax=Turicibacter sanguinis TaxID=154288 RepID=A0A9X4XF70_9FIRM|nr:MULTISPECIES: hypothetical protein [Turicibacter]EFF64877.1 hypothetical protein CUW_0699 [Turicibacter sanguinis PC909]MBP3903368.1 hypothetical protein [Turicibacter sp.]MCU7190372.1 hypothetical protein [Turicibacter sanguinis]MCU7198064.1 hypothetical protein [Turicibacter sanguinis]MCU7200736.1 hypothetical protein [Turicibacter sanguinis]